jgi:HD superfamily phosphohydrolase
LKGNNQRRRLLQCLSRTWVVQRLKHIDLSAVPRWLGPCVSTASRYQHSVAVGKLSFLVSGGTEHDQLLLTAAATLHDAGNGPFPHISDQIMEEMLGFRHEGAVRFAFENSPMKDSMVLEKYGLDLEEVAAVVKGGHRLSPLVNGQPDLDNVDNIYRFMTSIPGKPLGEPSYRPTEIAASMSLESVSVDLSNGLKMRWRKDWEKCYRYVWGDRLNMVCWTMLGRALRLMKEELTPRFFLMTNKEAFRLIKLMLPKLANGLKKKEFEIVLDREYRLFGDEARKLSDPANLRRIEDELCRETGFEDWSIGLTVDQPPIGERADHWRVYLIVYKGNEEPKNLLEDTLSSSVPLLHGG